MKETLKGAVFIIVATLMFGFMGIFVRFLGLPSFVIVFFSFLFSAIILLLFFLFKDTSIIFIKKHLLLIILLGIFNLFNNFFFFQAFVSTTISNAVLTHYTAPIFVALLAPFLLKERLEKITIISLIIAVAGLGIISHQDLSFQSNDFIGMMYGTASGLMYALVIIVIKHLSKYLSVFTINIYQSLIVALLMAPFVIVSKINVSVTSLFLLLLFALLFGVIATLLYMQGIKRIKSQHAGILAYIEPVAATFYAMMFFREIPTLNTIIGGVLILMSGYLIIRRKE